MCRIQREAGMVWFFDCGVPNVPVEHISIYQCHVVWRKHEGGCTSVKLILISSDSDTAFNCKYDSCGFFFTQMDNFNFVTLVRRQSAALSSAPQYAISLKKAKKKSHNCFCKIITIIKCL